jgi:hypothetical protein
MSGIEGRQKVPANGFQKGRGPAVHSLRSWGWRAQFESFKLLADVSEGRYHVRPPFLTLIAERQRHNHKPFKVLRTPITIRERDARTRLNNGRTVYSLAPNHASLTQSVAIHSELMDIRMVIHHGRRQHHPNPLELTFVVIGIENGTTSYDGPMRVMF